MLYYFVPVPVISCNPISGKMVVFARQFEKDKALDIFSLEVLDQAGAPQFF